MSRDKFIGGDPNAPLDPVSYPVLAHEAWHQRQFQGCGPIGRRRLQGELLKLQALKSRGSDPYGAYDANISDPSQMLSEFRSVNEEARAEIVEDYAEALQEGHGLDRFAALGFFLKAFGSTGSFIPWRG